MCGAFVHWFQVTALPSDRRIGAQGEQVCLLSAGRPIYGCLKKSKTKKKKKSGAQSPSPEDALGILLNFAVVILLTISDR